MAACQQSPTQTVFSAATNTVQSVFTSTSENVITGPPSTETSFSTVCIASASAGNCASFSTSTLVTVVAGTASTSTAFIPITTNVLVTTLVPIQTLFAPCSQTTSSSISTPFSSSISTPVSSSTSSQANDDTASTTSISSTSDAPATTNTPATSSEPDVINASTATSMPSRSLGTPTTFVSFVTVTASNGQLTTSSSLVTATPTLSSVGSSNNGKQNPVSAGLIAGSVIGGFLGLGLVVAVFWFFWRKRHTRWDDIFDKDEGYTDDPPRRSMNLIENEPKPYQYGIVGSQSALGLSQSPISPHAPPHYRTPSTVPLLLPPSSNASFDLSNSPNTSPAITPSARLPGHQSTQTLSSTYSYGYPPPQSPPFLPAGAALPPKQRPSSMAASSRNLSHSSKLSTTSSSSPQTSQAVKHARSSSAGHITFSQQLPLGNPLSTDAGVSPSTSQSNYGATSSGPSFLVQRKPRPQSYAPGSPSTGIPAPAPLVVSGNTEQPSRSEKGPAPSYEEATSPSTATNSAYVPLSMQSGVRLALANPDVAAPLSPGPSSAKQKR